MIAGCLAITAGCPAVLAGHPATAARRPAMSARRRGMIAGGEDGTAGQRGNGRKAALGKGCDGPGPVKEPVRVFCV